MADIEQRLRSAMHAAVDGQEVFHRELIKQVRRRHRRHTARMAGAAILGALALAVPTALALRGALGVSGPPSNHGTRQEHQRPTRMNGLPMPVGMNFEFLVSTPRGAGWYSTATRRTEPIAGLPAVSGGYQSTRLDGGWALWPYNYGSPCPAIQCAGLPTTFYFVGDGAPTATRIGRGYAGDGVDPGARAGTLWLITYPRTTTKLTASSFAQLVNTAGQPLGPRYRMPANYLMGRGVGSYLLLDLNANQIHFELWDPATRRVLGQFDNVVAQGPEQVVWSKGCRRCRLQVTNVSTGKTVTTPIPGRQPANLQATLSDDGQLLAVQLPSGELAVLNTVTGTLRRVQGTAVSMSDWQHFDWQSGGHRLVITAGPSNTPGPDQIAYWQPGATNLKVATIQNLRELPEIETGSVG